MRMVWLPCAMGLTIAMTLGAVTTADAQVRVQKDPRVVREEPGVIVTEPEPAPPAPAPAEPLPPTPEEPVRDTIMVRDTIIDPAGREIVVVRDTIFGPTVRDTLVVQDTIILREPAPPPTEPEPVIDEPVVEEDPAILEPEPQVPVVRIPAAGYWGIGGGASFPQGGLGNAYDTGWNVSVPIGWDPVDNPWGVRLDLTYNRLGGRDLVFAGQPMQTDPTNVWSAMFGGTLRLPILVGEGRSGPYVMGGLGLHHLRNFNIVATEEPVTPDQFGQFETRNVTEFGWNAGGGFAFGIGAASLFLESRYVNVFTEGRNVNYVPLILGVTF